MAQRFGGKHSPGASGRVPGTPEGQSAGFRATLLFFTPIPFLLTAFFQPPVGLAIDLAAFGALLFAARMTRDGIIAHKAYEARAIARRPAIPRKIFGSALTGIGLFLGAFSPDAGLLNPVILAALGTGLHFAAFGADPLRNKGMDGVDTFQQDRVARVLDEAEKHLTAMREAILRTGDRHLRERVDAFQTAARDMFRTVEQDPRDLTAARKYLGVYLMGARDATIKFAELWGRTKDEKARADYEALLTDLETNFAARTQTLLLDDRTDLNVEIDVLRDRLQREGVRTE